MGVSRKPKTLTMERLFQIQEDLKYTIESTQKHCLAILKLSGNIKVWSSE